mmetsp:Transcript_22882/g.30486  ORF Transcript_22882/g.30486 Transcript_22882/m.30486 type:complete len:100 (+) Transcript_22882:257-556(+)
MSSTTTSILVDASLLESPYEQLVKRQEFQQQLLGNVGAIRQCVTGLKEEIKSHKMKKAATHVRGTANLKADAIKERFKVKQIEVRSLFKDVKANLDEIG